MFKIILIAPQWASISVRFIRTLERQSSLVPPASSFVTKTGGVNGLIYL
jgi:hypothetical protein